MDDTLFKTRQLTEYREWPTGEKGCFFYVADAPIEKEKSYGAVFLIDAPWRKGDKIGNFDYLHQSEIEIIRSLKPIAKGFAAFLLSQNHETWVGNRQILDSWWKDYYDWCQIHSPLSGPDTEYIIQECLNWTIRAKDMIRCFLYERGMENVYYDALLHVIRNVFYLNRTPLKLAMRRFLPYMVAPEQNYIRYDYLTNALHMGTREIVRGERAIIVQYAAIKNILEDISKAQNLDKLVEYILDRLSDTPPHTFSIADVFFPIYKSDKAEKLYEFSWLLNKRRILQEYTSNIRFASLSEQEQDCELANALLLREIKQFANNYLNTLISPEESQKLRVLIVGYFVYLYKKLEGSRYALNVHKELEQVFPELQRNESHSQEQKGFVIQQNINAQGDYFAGGIGIQFVNGKQPQPTTASQKGTTVAPKRSKHFLETATFKYRYLNTDEGNRRLYLLYQFLSREYRETKSYIDSDTAPDDFCCLFSGEINNIVIIWTGSKQDLYYLIKRMVDRHIIDIPSSTTIWTITQNHFSDRRGNIFLDLRNQHKPKTSAEAIEHLIDILDPAATTPADLTELSKKLSTAFGGK